MHRFVGGAGSPEAGRARASGHRPAAVISDMRAAQALRDKLRTPKGRAIYKTRKAVAEPVFGQIKEQRGFRRFLLRGLKQVDSEWPMICATHNLLKLYRSGWNPQIA